MTVAEHILDIPRWEETTPVREILNAMQQWRCTDLPIFRGGQLYGKVDLDACIDALDADAGSVMEVGYPTVHQHAHIFDALRVMGEIRSSSLAVVDQTLAYCGLVSESDLVARLASSITMEQEGASILVETTGKQYSSSELSRIIEGENAQVLGLWLEHVQDSGRIRANIKVNTVNAERIVNSLSRFNYEVIATFGDADYREHVEKRYLSLMKYLDI